MPLIKSSSVNATYHIVRDPKKGTQDFEAKFVPIGLVENILNTRESKANRFSMNGRIRAVNVQSARKRIEHLRRN